MLKKKIYPEGRDSCTQDASVTRNFACYLRLLKQSFTTEEQKTGRRDVGYEDNRRVQVSKLHMTEVGHKSTFHAYIILQSGTS